MKMHQKSIPEEITNKFWGSVLKKFEHDILKHSALFFIEIPYELTKEHYKLFCSGVSEFNISYENPNTDWDYIELTEIKIINKKNGYYIECDLWSVSKLTICCSEIAIEKIIPT